MIKRLLNLFRKAKPVRKPIWVRFSFNEDWVAGESVNGIYKAYWWPVDIFPLRLNLDGSGTVLLSGLAGSGKPYPGFEWKPREGSPKEEEEGAE